MAEVKAEPAGDWVSPSVGGSTVSVNMGTDRSCPGFPGKKLKCTLPSHLSFLWLFGDSSLPIGSQTSCACVLLLPTSGHQIIGA